MAEVNWKLCIIIVECEIIDLKKLSFNNLFPNKIINAILRAKKNFSAPPP